MTFQRPFNVPQVGVLQDVANLPWRYRDYDRWTTAAQRAWTLDEVRKFFAAHPLAGRWYVSEHTHAGRAAQPLPDPYLVIGIYAKDSYEAKETSMVFSEYTRDDEALFRAQVVYMLTNIGTAAGV